MNHTILVAGGTGDLGNRIINALLERNATVIAPVRLNSDKDKVEELQKKGVQVIRGELSNEVELTKALKGVSCIVSALAGLRDVIVDGQSALLRAAITAGVPRFIPSDFASDFTKLPQGENRNFDLRKEFHLQLENAPIASTSIMNGAFTDILAYNTPFYNLKKHSVGYWGNDPDYYVDFTSKDDTAAYTAEAALDSATPRVLRIASFQISPKALAAMATEINKTDFKLIRMGSLDELSAYNKKERAAHPEGENELYPAWQGSQYMHSMFSVHHTQLDNDRYPGIQWTTAKEVLKSIKLTTTSPSPIS